MRAGWKSFALLFLASCAGAPAPAEPARPSAMPVVAAPSASAVVESPPEPALPAARPHRRVVRIDAFDYVTCVVVEDGRVRCLSEYSPHDVEGVEHAVDVAVGMGFACAATQSGSVMCWGNNNKNRVLGTDDIAHEVAQPVLGVSNAVAVAAAEEHACALRNDGKVVCWGRNRNYQLGRTDRDAVMAPVVLDGLDDVKALALTYFDTCALKRNGEVHCTTETPGHYLELAPLRGATRLSRGRHDLCGVMGDGAVRCWQGLSKAGSSTVQFKGVTVNGLPPSLDVARDEGDEHTCAIGKDGSVRCWGHNIAGELGSCTDPKREFRASDIPLLVEGVGGAVRLVASRNMTCALLADGSVRCWGQNKFGELGNGGTWIWARAGAEPSDFDAPAPPLCVSANMRYRGKVGGLARTDDEIVARVDPFGGSATCVEVDLRAGASRAALCPASLPPASAPPEWRSADGTTVRMATGESDSAATDLEQVDGAGKKVATLHLGGKAAFAGTLGDSKLVFVIRSSHITDDPAILGDTLVVALSPLRVESTIAPPLCVTPPPKQPACPR